MKRATKKILKKMSCGQGFSLLWVGLMLFNIQLISINWRETAT